MDSTAPMEVDGPPTRDFYEPREHKLMDNIVIASLNHRLKGQPWHADGSLPELAAAFRLVINGDPRLDRKWLNVDINKIPGEVLKTLREAWKSKSFREVRIRHDLQIPRTEVPMVVDSPATLDFYTPEQHQEMDKEVFLSLNKLLVGQRHEDLSPIELGMVFRLVIQGDQRLDRKWLEAVKVPAEIRTTLKEAWKAKTFQKLRIRCDLQIPETEDPVLAALEKAMNDHYKGAYVDKFVQYLQRNHSDFNSTRMKYYAKFCAITQSSGTGKTRLLLELGKKVLVLYMNIRLEIDTGSYPPRDMIPAELLTKVFPTKDLYRRHCQVFFAALFKCLAGFVNESDLLGVLSNVGNEKRWKFFENFQKEFDELDNGHFSPDIMYKHYDKLESCLPRQGGNTPKVVIALDEAHVLHEKTKSYLPATVLLQTIKEYSGRNQQGTVWVVFVSTAPKIAHYASPQNLFPSARVAVDGELLFPPFTQLGWDHHAPALNEVDLGKVAWGSHLLCYGRPLWWSLKTNRSVHQIIRLAAQKLCGSPTFDPGDKHQVFAVLGQRFGLDIAFGYRHAVQFNDTLVTNHLRFCIRTTDDQTWSYTLYPCEPIVSAAAAELLHGDEGNLTRALGTLSVMVNDGLIDTGDSGELASRFLWLLAKDYCVREGLAKRSSLPLGDLTRAGDDELPYCQPVPVVAFLGRAFGESTLQTASDALEKFDGAFVNFSHWIQMKYNITLRGQSGHQNDVSIEEWTRSLWVRTCAVQCCQDQPVIDKVIPIYFESGPHKGQFSHILISDKARDTSESRVLEQITRTHENIFSDYKGSPYIVILVDLGPSSKSATATMINDTTKDDPCLRISAAGLEAKTFPFLEENMVRILKDLYGQQFAPSEREFLEEVQREAEFGASRESHYMDRKGG